MRIARRVIRPALALAVVALVASCGGNDDGGGSSAPPATSNTPPASASASVDGFIAYLKGLVATMQDTVEPLNVDGFTAPTSDTTEPDPTV